MKRSQDSKFEEEVEKEEVEEEVSDTGSEGDVSSDEGFDSSDEDITRIGRQNVEDERERKRQKKSRGLDDGSEAFSSAMNALLDTKLKAHDRKDPILARQKGQFKKLESEKLEQKARRLMLAKKKAKLAQGRQEQLVPTGDAEAKDALMKERKLKKVAQRGVIKLFNAILMTQTQVQSVEMGTGYVSDRKKKEVVTEVSKDRFLEMVKEAGQ